MILSREVVETREGTRDDCLVEAVTDLAGIDCNIGSMAYCMADGKVYVKTSDGVWTEVAG